MSIVDVVSTQDTQLHGLIALVEPRTTEAAWLEDHTGLLGTEPQVNRFEKTAPDALAFDTIEVHPQSPQLTVGFEADLVITVFPSGWKPSDSVAAACAVRVPAGWGSIITPGIWHSGVQAVDRTAVMAAFRPGTLPDGTDVATLDTTLQIPLS